MVHPMEINHEEGEIGHSKGHLEDEPERQGDQNDAVKQKRTGSAIKSMILRYTWAGNMMQ